MMESSFLETSMAIFRLSCLESRTPENEDHILYGANLMLVLDESSSRTIESTVLHTLRM